MASARWWYRPVPRSCPARSSTSPLRAPPPPRCSARPPELRGLTRFLHGNTVVAMQRLLFRLVIVAVAAGCSNKNNGHTGQGGQGGPGGAAGAQPGSGGGQGSTANSVYERNN